MAVAAVLRRGSKKKYDKEKMKNIFIAFALFFITSFVSSASAQTAKLSGIKDVDFSNFSYRNAFDEPALKLSGGKFETDGGYDAGGGLYELFGQPVYGDLNGDKSEDVVVELKMSAPPSLRSFEVYAYAFQNGAAKMLARLNSDQVIRDYQKYYPKTNLHYAGTNPPTIKNGIVSVEALTEGNFACPKYTAVFNYKLSAGKFLLRGKPTRKNFNCSE